MPQRRLFWQFYRWIFISILVVTVVVAYYAPTAFKSSLREKGMFDAAARARLVAQNFDPTVLPEDSTTLIRWVTTQSTKASARVTLIAPGGTVTADSQEPASRTTNQAKQPEVFCAFMGKDGLAVRYSTLTNEETAYAGVPIFSGNSVVAVVRLAVPIGYIDTAADSLRKRILLFGILLAILTAVLSWLTARRLGQPLMELQHNAEQFAKGDFAENTYVRQSGDFIGLAAAMNTMASQLDERIQTVTRQRNEQEAILASMAEGLVAVDREERILSINRVAASLLEVEPDRAVGKTIQEMIRHTDLQEIVTKTLADGSPIEEDIVLIEATGVRYLQAHGTPLTNSQGVAVGAVVVLNDITRLRRLENVRRDFVANVSHELKTPITSIKGFVETLQDGAMNEPVEAKRFLDIIARHADRLNTIIEDLLTLSRIEQDADRQEIPREEMGVCGVLSSAIQTCSAKAAEKQISVTLDCDRTLRATINPALLEQAVVNLIDNAIKYSDSGRSIKVTTSKTVDETVISVIDEGCGISAEHLPRLWERFYRVDKARSRTLGGTGLGLAIAKHIMLAHRGRVSVDSVPGKGSTFRLHLPS